MVIKWPIVDFELEIGVFRIWEIPNPKNTNHQLVIFSTNWWFQLLVLYCFGKICAKIHDVAPSHIFGHLLKKKLGNITNFWWRFVMLKKNIYIIYIWWLTHFCRFIFIATKILFMWNICLFPYKIVDNVLFQYITERLALSLAWHPIMPAKRCWIITCQFSPKSHIEGDKLNLTALSLGAVCRNKI